jgi:hypothetical protein
MSTSKNHAFIRIYPTGKLAVLALLLLSIVTPTWAFQDGNGRRPDVGTCQDVQPPAGYRVGAHLEATGVQIYRWDGASWVFVAPRAVLFADAEGTQSVGFHYAGPTWETLNGGKVVGSVLKRCTLDTGTIPWLLLEAVHTEGPDDFARVRYVQRVNTVGGLAPTEPGSFPGVTARVPYTAEYYFYVTPRRT